MGNEAAVETLPATTEQSGSGMGGKFVSESEYAAQLVQQSMAKAKNAKEEQAAETVTAETIEEEVEAEEKAKTEAEVAEEGDKAKGDEQPEEQPESEEEPVLSKLDPKTQEKIQKRIGKVTARAKTAEEALEAEKAKNAELLAKLNQAPAEEVAPVVVPTDDPNDRTAAAKSEEDLAKLENDARNTIEFIEAHDKAITRAIAKDEDTVIIGGREFNVDELRSYGKEAKRHLERLIPQRRSFLKEHATAASEAKAVLPSLFDRSTADYQEFASFQRKNPAIRSVAGGELLYALAKVGERYLAEQKAKPATVKKAAATAPKTGADTGTAAATAAPKGKQSGEVGQLKVELGQAQKAFEANPTQNRYQQVLILQSRLKKLTN